MKSDNATITNNQKQVKVDIDTAASSDNFRSTLKSTISLGPPRTSFIKRRSRNSSINKNKRTFADWKDVDIYPSYTNFEIP